MLQETSHQRAMTAARYMYKGSVRGVRIWPASARSHTLLAAPYPTLIWLRPTTLLRIVTAEARLAALVDPAQLTV